MAAPSLPNFLIKWVYPAALTASNTYFLRNKINDELDDLKAQITGVKIDMKDMKDDMKRLTARQTELERRIFSQMAAAENLMKDCGEKCEIDERSLPFTVLCYASKHIP